MSFNIYFKFQNVAWVPARSHGDGSQWDEIEAPWLKGFLQKINARKERQFIYCQVNNRFLSGNLPDTIF